MGAAGSLTGCPAGIPRTDLRLVGQGVERFLSSKVPLPWQGCSLPVFVSTAWAFMGLAASILIPAVAGVAPALGLWFVPDWLVRDQPPRRPGESSPTPLAAYLELVALRMASNVGAPQALDEAARIGRGWPFARHPGGAAARPDRTRSRRGMPWRTSGRQLSLPILCDFADIMRLSSNDGAAVYDTLRARAKSLNSRTPCRSRPPTRTRTAKR